MTCLVLALIVSGVVILVLIRAQQIPDDWGRSYGSLNADPVATKTAEERMREAGQ